MYLNLLMLSALMFCFVISASKDCKRFSLMVSLKFLSPRREKSWSNEVGFSLRLSMQASKKFMMAVEYSATSLFCSSYVGFTWDPTPPLLEEDFCNYCSCYWALNAAPKEDWFTGALLLLLFIFGLFLIGESNPEGT